MGSPLLWYNVIMGRGEVRDVHLNGGNNGNWVESDNGGICPVADFVDMLDPTHPVCAGHDASGCANDVDRGDFCAQPRQEKKRAVAGMAVATSDVSLRKSQGNSRPNCSAKCNLGMSSQACGDLVDVLPPDGWNLENPAVRSAYIAYLSSLLGETKRALDKLRQSKKYLDEVAEYARQVDEANDNCPVQPRLTGALQAEAKAIRRINELQQLIDKIRRLGNKSND